MKSPIRFASAPTAPADADRLWEFACELYARPGIRALCLEWQEQLGADIPLVLALCWQAERRRSIPERDAIKDLARSLEPWRGATVLPLRRLRQRLKPMSPPDSFGARLRTVVQQAELWAERVQLGHLAQVLPRTPGRQSARADTRRGLARYLTILDSGAAERKAEVDRLLALIMPDDPEATDP